MSSTGHIVTVVGARPNLMKLAPLVRAFEGHASAIRHSIVHSGQHSDPAMDSALFKALNIPAPVRHLGARTWNGRANRLAGFIDGLSEAFSNLAPDWVLTIGDVDTALAAALAAKMQSIPLAHIEAGARSGNLAMPEEQNRRLIDAVADLYFAVDQRDRDNLVREGISPELVHVVGSLMADCALQNIEQARTRGTARALGLQLQGYLTLTLHRPENVDSPETLSGLLEAIASGAGDLPILFPVHPRTRPTLKHVLSLRPGWAGQLICQEPAGYLDMLDLMSGSRVIVTDSGGLQEECGVLACPCVIVRDHVERPEMLDLPNQYKGSTNPEQLARTIRQAMTRPAETRPDLPPVASLDGSAAERIASIFRTVFEGR